MNVTAAGVVRRVRGPEGRAGRNCSRGWALAAAWLAVCHPVSLEPVAVCGRKRLQSVMVCEASSDGHWPYLTISSPEE